MSRRELRKSGKRASRPRGSGDDGRAAAAQVSSARGVLSARFALRYLAIAALLFSAYAFPYGSFGISETAFDAYLAGYARLVGGVLGVFEPGIHVRDTLLEGRTSLQIVKSCDAIEAKLLLGSAILAFPAALTRKVLALLLGIGLLTALNVLRIVTLYYVILERRDAFEFVHVELWPLLMVVATAMLFLGSLRLMEPRNRDPDVRSLGHAAS
jgi:exosortase/archaeosortase family protein